MTLVRIAPIATILVVAAVLRFQALGAKCLWIDEALSYKLASFDLHEIITVSAAPGNIHPPLFFCLLHLWMLVAGDSEFALRLPAALFGVVSVAGAYLLLRQLLQRPHPTESRLSDGQIELAACLFALLVAVNPLEIFAAREVRGYTLGVALWLLGGIALTRALSRTNTYRRWLGLFTLCAIAQCYTHNVCLLMVAAQCLFLAASALKEPSWQTAPAASGEGQPSGRSQRAHLPLFSVILTCSIIALAYLPWLSVVVKQAVHVNSAGSVSGGMIRQAFFWTAVPQETFGAIFTTHESRWKAPLWASAAFSGLLFLILLRGLFQRSPMWKYLSLNALLPLSVILAFSSTSVRTVYLTRYLIFPAVPSLGAIALFVAERGVPMTRLLLLWLLANTVFYCCHLDWDVIGPAAAPGMRSASHFITSRMTETEPIIASGPFEQVKLAYYLRGKASTQLVLEHPEAEFWGRRYLRNLDLIDLDSIMAHPAGTIWWVSEDHSRLTLNPPFPDHWEVLESAAFPQQLRWERPVRVMHIRIHPHLQGADR